MPHFICYPTKRVILVNLYSSVDIEFRDNTGTRVTPDRKLVTNEVLDICICNIHSRLEIYRKKVYLACNIHSKFLLQKYNQKNTSSNTQIYFVIPKTIETQKETPSLFLLSILQLNIAYSPEYLDSVLFEQFTLPKVNYNRPKLQLFVGDQLNYYGCFQRFCKCNAKLYA